MNRIHITAMLTAFIAYLSACTPSTHNDTDVLPELTQAESVMYEHPDSALHILQTMDAPSSSEKLQKATWALLLVQAKYKNYVEETADTTLINIASDYFMKKEDAQRRAMALYYKGIFYKKANRKNEAQECYLKAIEEVEKTEDYQLAHLIYGNIGNIYLYNSLYEYALEMFEKSLHYAQLSNNKDYICTAYYYLGKVYSALLDFNNSIIYYKKAILMADTLNNNVSIDGTNELAGIYTEIKDYQSALFYAHKALKLKEAIRFPKRKVLEQSFLVIGDIYRRTNQTDSAYFYLNKALSANRMETVYSAYQALYYLSRDNKDYEKMNLYCDSMMVYQDSIWKLDRSKEFMDIQEKYNQQKIINEKNRLEMDKKNMINLILLAGIGIAIMVYVYQKKLLRKERLLQKKEEEINRNTLKIQENEMIIVRNRNRMEELTLRMEESKGMQEQLEEQNMALSEIQQQNEELKQENETLQRNIDKYSSSLTERSKELKKLECLTQENLRLRDRETYLSNLLLKDIKVIKDLKTRKSAIDVWQWEEVKKHIDLLFDNYTIRLSQVVPSMTEGDLQVCCLIKLRFSNQDIADILDISPTSVSKRKFRLKERIIQKLGSLGESHTLDLWLLEF